MAVVNKRMFPICLLENSTGNVENYISYATYLDQKRRQTQQEQINKFKIVCTEYSLRILHREWKMPTGFKKTGGYTSFIKIYIQFIYKQRRFP